MNGFFRVLPCLVSLAGLSSAACVHQPPSAAAAQHRPFDRSIQLGGRALTLHLSPGTASDNRDLVLYATGDGGWRGKDREVYSQLESWGYTAVGFSTPEFLRHLPGDDGTTTPDQLASDFAVIIDEAREALHLRGSRPVTLVGVSRGADLAVVAAGQPRLQPELDGVVVMGLTREEEYVRLGPLQPEAFDLYGYLPQLGAVPLSVIQSTRDNYVSADAARILFGQDTALRTLHAVDARDHSFGGARPLLYAALRNSLAWVDRLGRRPAR